MGKVVSIIAGTVCLVLGIISIIAWRGHFLDVLMGSVPVILILVGAIALFAGISEIKDSLASKEEEAPQKEEPEEKAPEEEKKEETKE